MDNPDTEIDMRPKCIRCGVCCVSIICNIGEESPETGLCDQLIIHKEGHTSCKQAAEQPNIFKLFGKGCPIRHGGGGEMFGRMKAQAELWANRSLDGLGGDDVREV